MEESVGYFELVRNNHNYRNLWFGQIVSLLGDWFNLIASASLVATLTQSGMAVGGLFVVRMLAPFLVSPIAGVFADRYSRKRLLISTDVARAVIVLGFLLIREPEHVWLLYALTAVQLGISGFFYPARSSILPDIVTQNELGAANALSSSTWSIMLSLGAALGGIVAGQWGIYFSFVVDSLTFFFSALFISQIRVNFVIQQRSTSSQITDAINEYIIGLKYLFDNPGTLVVSMLKSTNALATGAFQVFQVYLAEKIYILGEGGSTGLGLMYAVVGAGTGFGPIWARKITGDRAQSMRIAISFSYLITTIGLAITADLPLFWLLLVGIFLRGIGGGINWVFSTQVLLQTVPSRVLGRVFSAEFAAMTLSSALAAYIGGWGLDRPSLGFTSLTWWMAGVSLFFGILWTLWLVIGQKKSVC